MSEPAKPSLDVRPYAVRDALDPTAVPRVVIHTSPSAAVSYVVGARFQATALNAMEVLGLAAQGARVEDPRGALPVSIATPDPAPVVAQADVQPSLLPDVGAVVAGSCEPAPL